MTYFKMQMEDDNRACRVVVEEVSAVVTNLYNSESDTYNVTMLVEGKNPINWQVEAEQYDVFIELWERTHGEFLSE